MASRGRSGDEQIHLVTSAQRAHSEEMHGRTRRYLISMGIRTVCLVLAIFVVHGWLRLVFLAAAIALPWFAVVLANAGPVQDDEQPEFIDDARRELGPGSAMAGDAPDGDTDEPGPAEGTANHAPPSGTTSSETMAARHHGAS